jgi:hypothetical protein
VKKLRALQRIFHGPEPPTHAIALDAETAVNGFEGRRAWEYVKNWTSQKLVLANVGRGEDHQWRNKVACAGVGLPPLKGLPWFTDAPIFERDDFDDFHALLSSRARTHRSNKLGPGSGDPSFMEHASYMCFKAHVRNWTVLEANGHLEEYTARRQEERVADGHIRAAYSFTWARGPSAKRLLIFHMDRDRYWPALACGDDNNQSLGHVSLHTTDYHDISDTQTTQFAVV